MDDSERLDALCNQILPAQFERIVFLLGAPHENLSPAKATITERAIELIRWARANGRVPHLDNEIQRGSAQQQKLSVSPMSSRARSTAAMSQTDPVELGGTIMPVGNRLRAQEFLLANWTTYGITELLSTPNIYDDTPEIIEQFDRLTSLLARGVNAAQRQAAQMLSEWSRRNSSNEWASAFRLRRVLCLKATKDYETARSEAAQLVRESPDSATLHCLLGVLQFKLGEYQKALESNRVAVERAPQWVEPRISMVEIEIIIGQFERASENAERVSEFRDLTSRERLIVMAYFLVAKTISDAAYYGGEAYKALCRDIDKIEIAEADRESWYVDEVAKVVRRQENLADAAREELFEVLRSVHHRLNDEKPKF